MKKILSQKDLFSIALGAIIGWGAFVLPGNFFLKSAGVTNTAVGFFVAVIMLFFIEQCYCVLMKLHSASGGEFTFANNEFGGKIGFITGWMLLLAYISIIPLNATAVPMVLQSVITSYDQGALLYSIADYPVYLNDLIISLITIVIFTVINARGLKGAKWAQNFCILSLLFSIVALTFFGAFRVDSNHIANFASNAGSLDFDKIVRIITFAPWAFMGFDTVAQMSEEFNVEGKRASMAALIAVIFGAVVYNALNVFTAFGVHSSELENSIWATGEAVFNMLGPVAITVLSIAMLGAVVSGLNGFFMSSSRLILAMYRAKTDAKMELNGTIFYLIGAISCLVPFFGRNALFWFVDLASVGASFAYLVTCAAAWKVSQDRFMKFISIIGISVSGLFLLFLLTPFFGSNIPVVSAVCLMIWLALGGLVYLCEYTCERRLFVMSTDSATTG